MSQFMTFWNLLIDLNPNASSFFLLPHSDESKTHFNDNHGEKDNGDGERDKSQRKILEDIVR